MPKDENGDSFKDEVTARFDELRAAKKHLKELCHWAELQSFKFELNRLISTSRAFLRESEMAREAARRALASTDSNALKMYLDIVGEGGEFNAPAFDRQEEILGQVASVKIMALPLNAPTLIGTGTYFSAVMEAEWTEFEFFEIAIEEYCCAHVEWLTSLARSWNPISERNRATSLWHEPDPTVNLTEQNCLFDDKAGASYKDRTDWWHAPGDERPAEYAYGPIVATKVEICRCLGQDGSRNPRRLDQKARLGIIFACRRNRTTWEVYFKDQKAWERAAANHALTATSRRQTTLRQHDFS